MIQMSTKVQFLSPSCGTCHSASMEQGCSRHPDYEAKFRNWCILKDSAVPVETSCQLPPVHRQTVPEKEDRRCHKSYHPAHLSVLSQSRSVGISLRQVQQAVIGPLPVAQQDPVEVSAGSMLVLFSADSKRMCMRTTSCSAIVVALLKALAWPVSPINGVGISKAPHVASYCLVRVARALVDMQTVAELGCCRSCEGPDFL